MILYRFYHIANQQIKLFPWTMGTNRIEQIMVDPCGVFLAAKKRIGSRQLWEDHNMPA